MQSPVSLIRDRAGSRITNSRDFSIFEISGSFRKPIIWMEQLKCDENW